MSAIFATSAKLYNYLMFLLRIVLFPLAVLYDLITFIRNKAYDTGLKPAARFAVPVISIGNLTIGGTGKTPMVEHLIRVLGYDHKVATLSRGYGRKTHGMRIAGKEDNPQTLGDEPYQLYHKYGHKIVVAVGEDRALAIPHILHQYPETQVILLDDAFQHRRVKPSFSILLTDYNRPFYEDILLPAGRLRESREGANRADAIVVTKCPPEITDDEMMEIEKSIHRIAPKPVFFAATHYGAPQPFGGASICSNHVILVTGIAHAGPLIHYVTRNFQLMHHLEFSDHHNYTRNDILKIKELCRDGVSILTTEKDKVKIQVEEFRSLVSVMPFFFLPIEIEFVKSGEDFDIMVQTVIRDND